MRCWFAPHHMSIGGKILDEIDSTIRLREKLLLILSEHSIASNWVEDEVTKAFEEERKRGQTVLFPIRLDDAVMETDEAWASKLRAQRHIGDLALEGPRRVQEGLRARAAGFDGEEGDIRRVTAGSLQIVWEPLLPPFPGGGGSLI